MNPNYLMLTCIAGTCTTRRIAYNIRRAAAMIPNPVRITAWEEAACAEDIVCLPAPVPNTKTNLGVKIS